jgi:putative heme-binding domain-containing protein
MTGCLSADGAAVADACAGEGPEEARVVAAWAAGRFETRIVFNRAVDPSIAKLVIGRSIAIDETKPTVGSRPVLIETARSLTRGAGPSLRITAAKLENGGRTLVMTTDPHPRAATYTLEVPAGPAGKPIAVAYDLSGVEASWSGRGVATPAVWSGWWPGLNPGDVRARLSGSPDHARVLELLGRPGTLKLETLLSLPKGPIVVQVEASSRIEATLGGEEPSPVEGASNVGNKSAVFRIESTAEPSLLSVTAATGQAGKVSGVRVTTAQGPAPPSPLRHDQILLPWTPPAPPVPGPMANVPDLSKGDPQRGAVVFVSAEAKCSNCHGVRGQGGTVGPDLSGLVGSDRKVVYRDITEPSARINPDYVPYTVALKDGRILAGTLRSEGADAVRVSDADAKTTVVLRADVEEFRPSATSVMPVGLGAAIGEDRLRDLIAFLTTMTPSVAPPSPSK